MKSTPMHKLRNSKVRQWTLGVLLLCCWASSVEAAPHASAGLWVGEVAVNKVNEAASTVYELNKAPAPQPDQATPTADTAHLRLLLHVDSAGQVNLLKHVTVINKAPPGLVTDLVLITEDTLLSSFTGPGRRLSTSAFDFGDKNAHDYVETVSSLVAVKIRDDALAESMTPNMTGAQFNTAVANVKAKVAQRVAQALSDAQATAFLPPEPLPEAFQNLKNSLEAALLLAGSRAVEDALGARRAALDAGNALTSDELLRVTRNSILNFTAVLASFDQADAFVLNRVLLSGQLTAGGALTGTVFLGAGHPTNPFRHRRHPDHTRGYPIVRSLSLQITPPSEGAPFEEGTYGVDRFSGTFKEEIHGLYKPLGVSRNIGLIAEGTFTLNRVSVVGQLNPAP